MFIARCSRPLCRKAELTIRHHSPWSTPRIVLLPSGSIRRAAAKRPPSASASLPRRPNDPPTVTPHKNPIRLSPMRIWVASGRKATPGPLTTRWAPEVAHSGQWKPTDAWIMQDGQIGRSQRWQTTPARRSSCR